MPTPLSKEQQRTAMSKMTAKMLEGWTLLSSHCPLCTTTLIRSKSGEVFCSACEATLVTTAPQGATSTSPSSSAVAVTPSPSEAMPSSPPPPPPRQVNTRAARDDEASSRLGQRLLNGWKMLAEGCNKCGTPLMQPLKSMGGGDPECVMCVEVGPPTTTTSSSSSLSSSSTTPSSQTAGLRSSPKVNATPTPSRAYVPSPLNPTQRTSTSSNNSEAATSTAPSSSSSSAAAPQSSSSTSSWLAALEEVQRGISVDEESGPRARTISSSSSSSSSSPPNVNLPMSASSIAAGGSTSTSSNAAAAAAVVLTPEEQLLLQWESMMRQQKQQFDSQNDKLMERMRKTNPQLASLLIHRQKEKNAQLQLQVVQFQNKLQSTSPPKNSSTSPKALDTSMIKAEGASGGTSGSKMTAPGGFSTAPGQTPGMPVFGSTVLPAPSGWEHMSREDLNDFVSKKLKAVDGQGGSTSGMTHEAPNFPQPVVPVMTPPVLPLLQSSSSSSSPFSSLMSTSSNSQQSTFPSSTRTSTQQPLPPSSSSSSSSSSSRVIMHSTLTAELLEEAKRNGAATAAAAIAAASSSSNLASQQRGSLNQPLRSSAILHSPLSPPLASPLPMSAIVPGQLLRVSDVSAEDGNIGPTGVVKFIGSRVFTVPEPSEDMIKRIERGLEKAAEEERNARQEDTVNSTSSSSSSFFKQQRDEEDEEYLRGAAEVQANRGKGGGGVSSSSSSSSSSSRQRVLALLERSLDERCDELLASGEEPKLIERRWIFEGIKGLAETVAALRAVT